MEQGGAEKMLACLYPLIALMSFICTVTSAVAWNHWKYVLDTCIEVNCGCILHGISTPTYFTGGHVAHCHWAVYGPLIAILISLIFGVFHCFRYCFGKGQNRSGTTTVRHKSGDVLVMTTRSEVRDDSISPYYWIPTSVIGSIFIIYSLVHAAMLTIGFMRTCKQYRNELIKYMHATGDLVGAIQSRISCAAVFDFMDYLHPNVNFTRRRDGRINTSAALVLAMISSWMCVLLWIIILVINIGQARSSRQVRV